jgi:hypothetical protein
MYVDPKFFGRLFFKFCFIVSCPVVSFRILYARLVVLASPIFATEISEAVKRLKTSVMVGFEGVVCFKINVRSHILLHC